jgi:hypothetical protein
MANFNQSLPWLADDSYLPSIGNRINQQYDRWSINDLYLGYGNNLDTDETIDPFLVARCSPHKQPTVDLLSEAITRVNRIDRYREDVYDIKRQVTNYITRVKSVEVIVYATFYRHYGYYGADIYVSQFSNPPFLYGFYHNTPEGYLLAYPESADYTLTELASGYFSGDYTYGFWNQNPLVALSGFKYRSIGSTSYDYTYDANGFRTDTAPPFPFLPRIRKLDEVNSPPQINGLVYAEPPPYYEGFVGDIFSLGYKPTYETIATTSLVNL